MFTFSGVNDEALWERCDMNSGSWVRLEADSQYLENELLKGNQNSQIKLSNYPDFSLCMKTMELLNNKDGQICPVRRVKILKMPKKQMKQNQHATTGTSLVQIDPWSRAIVMSPTVTNAPTLSLPLNLSTTGNTFTQNVPSVALNLTVTTSKAVEKGIVASMDVSTLNASSSPVKKRKVKDEGT